MKNGNVVLYFVLLLATCAKPSPTCEIKYGSTTRNLDIVLKKLKDVMFDDYEVPVVSNLEQDKHCLAFWETYDTYTILDNISGKAEPELKERITTLKTELRFVEECTFSVSKTCAKHMQPLVQVLQKLDPKQLENIKGNYSNCTEVRCYLGNTSALTDQSVYHLGNGTTNYSTEGRDAETQLNYDYLQQNRSILSNNTASDKETERYRISPIVAFLVAVAVVFFCILKKKCCGLHAENHNRAEKCEMEKR